MLQASSSAGPTQLYDWASDLHEQGQSSTHHNLLNHTCEIDGDVAHTETYYLFAGRNRDETNWIAGGRYIDRLERRDGTWKIALRSNAIEWSGMVPTMAIPFADVPDIHLNGVPSRSKKDPSYRRPLTNRREKRHSCRLAFRRLSSDRARRECGSRHVQTGARTLARLAGYTRA